MQGDHSHTRRRFIKGAGTIGTIALAGCGGNAGSDGSDGSGGTEGSDGSDGSGGSTGTGSESMADSIVFYNAGSLKYDPGTEENITRFEEETGISVEVNEVPWNNLKTSLTTIWRNKDATVDAFNGPTWWLADFVASDWLEPLELSDSHMSNFPENLRNLVTLDGKTYMAPEFGKWGTYLYDAAHFEEQGVSEPPQTWDEVVSKGKQLNTEDTSPFAFTWSNKDVFTFKQFLYQAGGQLFNDSNEPTFVDAGMDVMNFFTRLRENDLLPNGISSMGEGGAGDTFIAGQLASVESWTPLGARALDADGWGADRLGSAKPPEGPDSRATFQDTNGISVSAFSENKRAAKKFAQYMTTPASSKTNMKVEGNPAVIPSVYDEPEIQDQYPSWLLEDMKFNLEHAKSETYLAQPQVDDYLSEQITPALLGDKDPQDALETAQSNIERLYQDIGLL
ncbi:sugar ABC transporter substrate-binding protein [Haloarcula salina]|uniref:Extracellular solute-binding protein n=1 Tax=Haloarcula salina TaxID=1429914 RepID=A0AA41KBT2_9EURY|nr:extracellular solute-binding protein [Haloarcula salina]MBV0901600.1 extracellular solute-binding protein [Haloarcula salina]